MDDSTPPSPMEAEPAGSPPPSKSWSIHTRREIITKYEILERVGSGAYSDVYRARRRSDSVTVALKEVHDYTSAFREIEALQTLRDCPNVVVLLEYFWSEDEDAVLVLEYLPTDLAAVIKSARKEWEGGLSVGELKRWIVQILLGLDACHRNSIAHRDLKPSNLLISADGVLKVADFGQARILLPPTDDDRDDQSYQEPVAQPNEFVPVPGNQLSQEQRIPGSEEVSMESHECGINDTPSDIDKYAITSNAATYSMSDQEDPFQHSYSYYSAEGGADESGALTSCVGTRWFRCPELLFGSTNYGLEIDLWSVGCIFAELLSLKPIFTGTSDIDQLGKIFSILGNLTKEVWPGCVKLPDFNIISFEKVEVPTGLEGCLPNRSPDEVSLVKRLLCFDPAGRATAAELLQDKYLNEEPIPVPLAELRVPSKHGDQDEDSSVEWNADKDFDWESDSDDFASFHRTGDNGFSIRFS